MSRVLILGGQGRIGFQVAQDLLKYTNAALILTARHHKNYPQLSERIKLIELDLEAQEKLEAAIKDVDLVIHCAGPFHYRDGRVLKTCINAGKDYIDVSDHRSFYQQVIGHQEAARKAGVTAVLNTGVFPGISNSIVRQGVEKLDETETIHLSYVVAGSGGAGLTVMRTTFLSLRKVFLVWLNNQWDTKLPYTEREVIEFSPPYNKTSVYWFDMPETYTFAESFKVKNVITKFGSIPDFYNHLTWITAHVFPAAWLESTAGIEFFSKVSYQMTTVTDKFTGIGVAMQAKIQGKKDNKPVTICLEMTHEHTAIAAGSGTGSVAQLLLEEKLKQPGIYPVEQVLPTELFTQVMRQRQIAIREIAISN